MEDWLSYRLSDLLLFSPRTYYRMFELYHRDIRPAQLVGVAVALAIFVLLLKANEARRGTAIAAMLAVCWLWVAVAFHVRRYSAINPAAQYFAALFVVQAVLLVWSGVVRTRMRFPRRRENGARFAPGLFVLAVVVPPLAGVATGRTWSQVELVGLTPDATAIATIAFLLLTSPRAPRALMLLPLCWCLIGGATLWALGSAEAWVSIAAGLAALTALLWRPRSLHGQSFHSTGTRTSGR
jgi:hypothetical protein